MIKKFGKKMLTSLMALAMVFGVVNQTPVYAADEPLSFNADSTYAVVSADNGKAINIKAIGWQTKTTVDGVYIQDGNKVSNKALLKFTPTDNQTGLADDQVRVKIEYVGIEDNVYPIRSEGGNDFVFADSDKRTDACEYIITKTTDGKGFIQDTTRDYYFSINENGEIVRINGNEQATEFTFIENPTVADFTYYIEHVASGKYVKANGVGNALTVDGDAVNGIIGDDLRWTSVWGEYNGRSVTFNSKATPDSRWQGGNTDEVKQIAGSGHGGWESIRVLPNGNGTISFKDTADGKFFTVQDNKIVKTNSTTSSDENGEFIIHSLFAPEKATQVTVTDVEDDSMTVSWTAPVDTFFTGYKVVATPAVGAGSSVTSEETANTTMTLTGLQKGTSYTITVQTVNGEDPYAISDGVYVQTKNGKKPAKVIDITATKETNAIKVEWEAVETATSYDVYRAESAYSEYVKIASDVTDTNYIDTNLNEKGVYYNYYKVVAKNENGESNISDAFSSLETEMFGENVIIFADTDDTVKINEITKEIFKRQNSFANDAQFNENRYAIYFKPGDYVDLDCISVGFYTHIGGLGKTPYDVQLNNIEVPAYLDGDPSAPNSGYNYWDDNGAGGKWRNATCNFWRSAENLSVVGTGEVTNVPEIIEDNATQAGLSNWKKDYFNWSVAQAAPLRRVYSTRNVSYDYSYGWASGGYTADCYFTQNAGTGSGQQYFTRNTVVDGDAATGTTLNNFNMGVVSDSLDAAATTPLVNGNGYSNWSQGNIGDNQNVLTHITETPEIREKPFLFLDDDGEYKVFVPAMRYNAVGKSWSENDMGEGKIVSLDEFYIAKKGDTAAKINEELKAGKNIFFTPGVYHAEEVINVEKEGTIVLGTGMASIIPDNEDAAMRVADVDGVTIAGLIFDAGAGSKYLLQVGEEGKHIDHSDNPTLLADLFFRVGGTTTSLTKADIALEINSDNVISDHFWIWRADHGTGVAWDGNVSTNGLIVNGDGVTCYALFNEHFQENDTLWNGNNGSTYFYQNEKCYDPISQEKWLSHNDAVNGYSAYKVANDVTDHYAVGLGIYNVFINTGENYDSMEVQIQLDNAIEVPNSENVLVENACVQTFAKDEGVLQKFNHIINGVGNGVSSGTDPKTGETGDGWSRQFLISYNNGTAVVGKMPDESQKGKFVGVNTIENIVALGDENLDFEGLKTLIDEANALNENDYTAKSWKVLADILDVAEKAYNNEDDYYKYAFADKDNVWTEIVQDEDGKEINKTVTIKGLNTIKTDLKDAIDALKKAADKTALKDLYDSNVDKNSKDYTSDSWKAFDIALKDAETVLANEDATQEEVDNAYNALEAAIKGLVKAPVEPTKPVEPTEPTEPTKPVEPTEPTEPTNPTPSTPNKVDTGDMSLVAPYAILAMCALGAYVTIRKRENG